MVKLYGGLGNQMFQFATGRALALRRRTELALDVTWFSDAGLRARTPREFELSVFAFRAKTLDRTAPSDALAKRQFRTVREPGFVFAPEVLDAPDDSLLDGYWQSERYFADAEQQLRSDLRFKGRPSRRNRAMLRAIRRTREPVSLHVRRGDYVHDEKTHQFHGVAGLDYYDAAIDVIRQQVQDPQFFVFSDDPEWCRDNLELPESTTFVDHNSGKQSFEDMRLMSNCRHHIVANSSFSWWGAWLAANKDKTVVAPRRWFADETIDTSYMLPAGWRTL